MPHSIRRFPLAPLALLATAGLVGCSTPVSYLRPSSSDMTYEQLRRPEVPQRLRLTTAFQRNGQLFTAGDPQLRTVTERVLRTSGIIEPAETRTEGEIGVVVNNVSRASAQDLDAPSGRLGLSGGSGTAADHYVMSVTIRSGIGAASGAASNGADRPRYFSASNSAEAPTGLDLMSSDRSFGKVVEQLLLGILKEYQDRGNAPAGGAGAGPSPANLLIPDTVPGPGR